MGMGSFDGSFDYEGFDRDEIIGYPAEETDISFKIQSLSLIDTSKASWGQIIEIRNLKNLRLFFFSNYQDKPGDFVKDDLLKRIDEYDSARKKHGFDLKATSMLTLLKSKNLQSYGLAALEM